MHLLTPEQTAILNDSTQEPQDAFDKAVKSSTSFKKLQKLCTDRGVSLQTFDLPDREHWIRLGASEQGMMIDMLHFTSSQQSATVDLYGLRKQHTTTDFMVLECREIYRMSCTALADADHNLSAQRLLDSSILCNSKSAMTPWDEAGVPYDLINDQPIKEGTSTYNQWIQSEQEVLGVQLECISELASAHGVRTFSLLLGGRGSGAKKGQGGSHLKFVVQAHDSLSSKAQQMIVLPNQTYQ